MTAAELTDLAAEHQGVSLAGLGRMLGARASTVTAWRKERAPVPAETLARLIDLATDDPGLRVAYWLAYQETHAPGPHAVALIQAVRRATRGGMSSAQNVYSGSGPFGRAGGLRIAA